MTSHLNQYYFVWFTDARWAGTCRELLIRMRDGTQQKFLFHFPEPAPTG